jgi:hypothetical protein
LRLAERPGSLEGKVIGLLDNAKDNSGVLLDCIATELAEFCPPARIVRRRKTFSSRPADFIDELASECEVVLSGVGD